MTKIICDLCGSDINKLDPTRRYKISKCNCELDICNDCYKRFLNLITDIKKVSKVYSNYIAFPNPNPDQITFGFTTEEKNDGYYDALFKDDPQPWKK